MKKLEEKKVVVAGKEMNLRLLATKSGEKINNGGGGIVMWDGFAVAILDGEDVAHVHAESSQTAYRCYETHQEVEAREKMAEVERFCSISEEIRNGCKGWSWDEKVRFTAAPLMNGYYGPRNPF